jgi:hypothetical protein
MLRQCYGTRLTRKHAWVIATTTITHTLHAGVRVHVHSLG